MDTKIGNILALTEGILVHGCNCKGVMGSGLAKSVKAKWGDVFTAYKAHEQAAGLRLGDIVAVAGPGITGPQALRHVHRTSKQLPARLIVVNAMTQEAYGREPGVVYADYDAIESAFLRVALLSRDTGLPVHFPLIGAGLAQGSWSDIAERIELSLRGLAFTLWQLPD